MVERHAMVTAATCQRVDQGRRDAPPAEYDVVIVDEAARAGIDVLVPMTLGRSLVLVGDHRQLPPHVERDLADRLDEGIRAEIDLEHESLFSWLWKRLPRGNLVSLSRQYRMHEDIGRVVSRLFYEPEITLSHHHADERAAARRPDFGLCGNEPFVWVDTSDVLQDAGHRLDERVAWPCVERNEYEARLIVRLLRRIERGSLAAWSAREGRASVGVIAFYGEQVALLEAVLAAELDAELHALVQVGSVDSFQGREFPLVLLSAVRSNRDGFVGFLRMPNRINVAMSRAQRQLIIVGDSRTLAARGNAGSPSFQRLFEDLSAGRSRGLVLKSAEVVR
jgi:superfamily I DNA and/or RNA helicase